MVIKLQIPRKVINLLDNEDSTFDYTFLVTIVSTKPSADLFHTKKLGLNTITNKVTAYIFTNDLNI